MSEWDPCLFYKNGKDGSFHYIGVYVDDLVHVYSDEAAYSAVVDKFKADFRGYTELPLVEIFNAEVAVTPSHVQLTQTRYIEELQKLYCPDEVPKVHTPALTDLLEIIKACAESNKNKLSAEEHAKYRAIVGAVLYLATVCRPDVAVAVGYLSRVLECPDEACMAAAMRILHYLVHTKTGGVPG